MTPQQDRHLDSIVEAFNEAVIKKYQVGAKEHGGNLWELSNEKLLDEAINETIDQFTYPTTLKQKLQGKGGITLDKWIKDYEAVKSAD